jgi:hypothetical protein
MKTRKITQERLIHEKGEERIKIRKNKIKKKTDKNRVRYEDTK